MWLHSTSENEQVTFIPLYFISYFKIINSQNSFTANNHSICCLKLCFNADKIEPESGLKGTSPDNPFSFFSSPLDGVEGCVLETSSAPVLVILDAPIDLIPISPTVLTKGRPCRFEPCSDSY